MAALTLRKRYGGGHWHRRGMRILQQSVGMPENTGRKNMVYELLKNQVLNLELKPGEMLSENSLAAQMHAGRPLVRDALAQLTEEGYVVVYPQRGTEVSLLSQSRIRQAVQTTSFWSRRRSGRSVRRVFPGSSTSSWLTS